MWLPKDERKLLTSYFRDLPEASFGKKYTSNSMRVVKANRNLNGRHLINLDEYRDTSNVSFPGCAEGDLTDFLPDPKDTGGSYTTSVELTLVELTLRGWDLGRKYNHWFTRTGLWFAEYKQHWIWIIVAFLGGIVGTLIVQWLKNIIFY